MPPVTWKVKPLAAMAQMSRVKAQLKRVSQGKATRPGVSPLLALMADMAATGRRTRWYRKMMAASG